MSHVISGWGGFSMLMAAAPLACGRRQGMRRCSLLAALLYCLTAGQIAVFILALWQNGWQIEALTRNPLVRAISAFML